MRFIGRFIMKCDAHGPRFDGFEWFVEKLQPSIKVKTVAVDFTKDRAIYQQMAAELRDLEIGVLVNNVGMCENFCEPFSDIQSDQIIDDMVACNVVSVPRMIHMILPGMLQRKRGIIINIGSMAGAIKIPLGTLYGATKVGSTVEMIQWPLWPNLSPWSRPNVRPLSTSFPKTWSMNSEALGSWYKQWYLVTSWPIWWKATPDCSHFSVFPTLKSTWPPLCALLALNPARLVTGSIKFRLAWF